MTFFQVFIEFLRLGDFLDSFNIVIEPSYPVFIFVPRFTSIMDNAVGSTDSVPDVMIDAPIEEKKVVDILDDVGENGTSDVVTDSSMVEHKPSEIVETDHHTEEVKAPVTSVHIEVVASPLFRGDVIQRELYESPVPKSPVVDEEERPMDKRSGLVDRHRQLKQVMC